MHERKENTGGWKDAVVTPNGTTSWSDFQRRVDAFLEMKKDDLAKWLEDYREMATSNGASMFDHIHRHAFKEAARQWYTSSKGVD